MGNTGDEPHPPSAPGASQPLSRRAAPTAPRLAFFARPRHTLRMLAQRTHTLTVATTGRKFHDLTGEIAALSTLMQAKVDGVFTQEQRDELDKRMRQMQQQMQQQRQPAQ